MLFQKRGWAGVCLNWVLWGCTLSGLWLGEAQAGESALSRVTVTGRVAYEPRYTRVLDVECGDVPCQESQRYWNLVIQEGQARYLLNQRFNLGQSSAPEVTDLAGVQVSPGALVQLEGDVMDDGVDEGSRLFSIQKVHHVQRVMDLGWACFNQGGSGTNIYARVWRDAQSGAAQGESDPSVYQLRVQEVVNRSTRPVAWVERARAEVRSEEWVFEGQSITPSDVSVELQIHEARGVFLGVPAQLKITRKSKPSAGSSSTTANASESSVVEMTCTRTRSNSLGVSVVVNHEGLC
jgi:hypothetical protein